MENTSPITESAFLTVAQAAERMGKSEEFVRLLCKEGSLPGAVQDYERGPWRIPIDAVEAWLQQHTVLNAKDSAQTHTVQLTEPPSSVSSFPSPPGWWERLRHHPLIFYPATVFIILASIAAFVGVLISSGADFGSFRQQLREWGIPIKELPVASEGETLILIATFHNTTATNVEAHTKIARAIAAEAAKHNEQRLRVAVEPTELTADQRPQAEALGNRYNASMVIWGEDSGVEVIVNFLNLRNPEFAAAAAIITERERTQLANPPAYARYITDDLPEQLTFLALFAIGQSYYTNRDYVHAVVAIKAAVAALGDNINQPELADAYYRLCWLYQVSSLNNLDESITNCTKTVELKPDYAEAYNNRGSAYTAQYKLEEAIVDFNRVIKLKPDLAAIAYYNLGVVRKTQNKLDEAIADYDRAIALKPDFAEAYLNRCAAYVSQIKSDKAIIDCSKAVELRPDYAEAYNIRGNAHFLQNKWDAAIVDYTKAIELKPDFAGAYNNRGNAYMSQDKLAEALADFDKAIALEPNFAGSYLNRGNAYMSQDKLKEAISDFHRYLELQPDTEARIQVEERIAELEAVLAKQN